MPGPRIRVIYAMSTLQIFSSNATTTDVDSSVVTSLRITVAMETTGSDIITPDVDGVTITMTTDDAGRDVIEYSGDLSIVTCLDTLSSIRYINSDDEPMPGQVRLLVQVFTLNETSLSGETSASNVVEAVIEVVPINDNDPVFSAASYSSEVLENSSPGSVVATVQATDGDIYSDGSITYEIEGGSSEFGVDANSGTISTTRHLDAELTSLYQLVIIASDNDGSTPRMSTVAVTISVVDVNDNVPVFNSTKYIAMVTENAIIGQSILTVSASDNDITMINNDIIYELQTAFEDGESGSGDLTPLPQQQATPFPFTIDPTTGEIVVAGPLDHETVSEYSLVVMATDTGSPPLSAEVEVVVDVLNVNDESPQFTESLYTGSISEDTAPGTLILTVLALDRDSERVIYTIDDSEYLDIDLVTGEVTLKRVVEFSLTPSLTATVIANDTGSPPAVDRATVGVAVVNINNNAPEFSQNSYTFVVTEGAMLEAEVVATDADLDVITYHSLEGFNDSFVINSTSGVIMISPGIILDYETQSMYMLIVAASDGVHSTPVSITVEVEDANDNAPSFTGQYSVTIPESSTVGTAVVQVEAMDRDSGSNAAIVYAILEGGDMFTIGADTGIITIAQTVDFETNPGPFIMLVMARNTQPPFSNDSTIVTVTISDSNDNIPTLTLPQLSYTYQEEAPPLYIASDISITDADSHIHPLTLCEVSLARAPCRLGDSELASVCESGLNDCSELCTEEITINSSLLDPAGLEVAVLISDTTQTLRVSGTASEPDYQTVLSSLTYTDHALEPSPGIRNVSLQCYDDQLSSNVLLVSVDVVLINDNPIMIEAESQLLTFVEGESTLPVGVATGVQLIDLDVGSEVTWVRLSLENPREVGRETLSVSPVSVTGEDGDVTGDDVTINQTSSLNLYQVSMQ